MLDFLLPASDYLTLGVGMKGVLQSAEKSTVISKVRTVE